MTTREDCVKWYGEQEGNFVYDNWQDSLKRIAENPTVISAPPKIEPYCMECGGDKIGYKTTQPSDEVTK